MKQSDIKRDLRINEDMQTRELLEKEKVELAQWMHDEGGILFQTAMDIVNSDCDLLLPGYRGNEKLVMFRREIRDGIKASLDGILRSLDERDDTATEIRKGMESET